LIESWARMTNGGYRPMPWGDGKVDAKDLEIFMSYWGRR